MARKNRLFAKLASDVDTSGNLAASGIQSEALDTGVTVYATRASLPTSGNTAGDQAYVTGNNRLYIWNGSGWYNIALLNVAPSIQSVLDSGGGTTPFSLAIDGTATTITITAADSDGDPITYSSTADSDFSGLAIISQADNVFTITPFSQDSATTSAGTITFTATDGINIASSGVQTFTLYFVSPYWDETVLSVGTSSTNSLDNSTFIDRSTNAHTVTPTGSPVQTAFHPYLDNWSVEFDGGSSQHVQLRSYSSTPLYSSNDDLTIECWVYSRTSSVLGLFDGTPSQAGGIRNYPANAVAVVGGTSCTFTLPTFEWAHFAAVFDSTSITVYINGTSSNTVSHSGYASKVNFDIGTINGGGDGKFNGYISDFRITTEKLYTSNFTPPTGKLTQLTNTTFLGLQNNRFMAADNVYGGTINAVNGAAISSYHPFGQESEYAISENKGSGYFDGGTSTRLTLPSDTSFAFGTSAYTVEAWIYISASTTGAIIFDSGAASGSFSFLAEGGYLKVSKYGTGAQITSSAGAIKTNKWHHCAVVRSSTSTNDTKLYVDGVLVGTGTDSNNWSTTTTPSVGGVNLANYTINGHISDLRVVKGTAVYTSAFTPPTAPVGNTNASLYLPMDNAGIYDKTGNNTLTLFGNASTSTTETKYATTSIGLDGSGDYVFLPNSSTAIQSLSQGSSWTIEFWGYITFSGSHLLGINTEASGSNAYLVYGTGVNLDGAVSSNTVPLNQWVHHAIVYEASSGNLTYYRDGTQIYQRASRTTLTYPISNCVIGFGTEFDAASGGSPGNYTNGYMEDINIVAAAKYTANFTPPTLTQGRTYQAES